MSFTLLFAAVGGLGIVLALVVVLVLFGVSRSDGSDRGRDD